MKLVVAPKERKDVQRRKTLGSDKCLANSRWTFLAIPNRFDCRVDSCVLEILRAIGTPFCQIVLM